MVEHRPTASNLSRREVERYKSCPLCSRQSPTAALTISEGKLCSSVSQSNCSLPTLSGPGHLHQMTHLHTACLSPAKNLTKEFFNGQSYGLKTLPGLQDQIHLLHPRGSKCLSSFSHQTSAAAHVQSATTTYKEVCSQFEDES